MNRLRLMVIVWMSGIAIALGADDGGCCSKCGKMTMRGSNHVCVVGKGSDSHRGSLGLTTVGRTPTLEKKTIDNDPPELRPLTGRSSRYVLSRDIRRWRALKGKYVDASLGHISKEGDVVWLRTSDGRTLRSVVSNLVEEDRIYIDETVAKLKSAGKVWFLYAYVDPETVKKIERENRAKEIIKERDHLAQRIDALTVTTARDRGGYAMALGKSTTGKLIGIRELADEVFYFAGKLNACVDGDQIIKPRYYWAGTMKYTLTTSFRNYWGELCSYRKGKTTHCFTSDLQLAINRVAEMLELSESESNGGSAASPGRKIDGGALELWTTGSGFVVSKKGYVITNQHVVDGAKRIEIVVNAKAYEAQLVRVDKGTDLALLKVSATVQPVVFSTKRQLPLGSKVFTVGFPQPKFQGSSPKVTERTQGRQKRICPK